MSNKVVIVAILITAIVVGGYFLLKTPSSSAPSASLSVTTSPHLSISTNPTPTIEKTPVVSQNLIIYTNSGYSPSTLRVKLGTIVTFKNESSQAMWTASAVHPTHTVYSGSSIGEHCPDRTNTTFDACTGTQPGSSWSFTFAKKGAWKYHNHLSPGDTGTIIVE